jgi:hypothetical protein
MLSLTVLPFFFYQWLSKTTNEEERNKEQSWVLGCPALGLLAGLKIWPEDLWGRRMLPQECLKESTGQNSSHDSTET